MKKFLGFMVMGFAAIMPFSVDAASEITYNCGDIDATGSRTCSVGYKIDAATPKDSVSVTLTEEGGADITSIEGVADSEFSISTKNESNGVWSVVLVSPDTVGGEFSLFTFTYKVSGTENCKVKIAIGDENKEITETPAEPDVPTENKQTGTTLPYIALGAVALIAVGGYLTTKNKSKMYKI